MVIETPSAIQGYYIVQSVIGNINSPVTGFLVKADSATDAYARANAIYSSGLTPYWTQAKIWAGNKLGIMYYCPYSSAQYQLSEENSKQTVKNPAEFADYFIGSNDNKGSNDNNLD